MSYSDKFKVVWLNPMRTATRSCISIQKKLGFEEWGVHDFNIPEDRFNYQVIVNIRNPYSRLVSLYKLDRIWEKSEFNINDFEPWIKDVLHDSKIGLNISTVHLDRLINGLHKTPDIFIKLENLNEDLRSLWFINDNIGILESEFNSQINENLYINEYSKHIPWQNFYNQKLSDFVYEKTQNQFEMFNYEKDSWKDGTS